jgi:mannose-6-phosphate isomerase-like protein (cupin superfamily)
VTDGKALKPISRETARHYVWGEKCDGWHLVEYDALSVISESMPRGTSEVPHFHNQSRQFFYVIAGRLRIEADGRNHELLPGMGLEIPPGLVHRVANGGATQADFVVVSQPKSHGDRINIRSSGVASTSSLDGDSS